MSMSKSVAVLIVDDEPPIRRFLRSSLAAAGYRVVESEDAAGALRLLTAEKPDVIILDLGLPDRSGFDLIPEIRKHIDGADRRSVGAPRRTLKS